jgi:hypothetical protein
MTVAVGQSRRVGHAAAGAVSGVISTATFTVVHYYTISNIWPMFVPMAVVGAVCGATIAASFTRLTRRESAAAWAGYNLAYLVMLGSLAAASVAVFEPVTAMAAVTDAGGSVGDLIARALPLTVGFVVVAGGVIGAVLARRPTDYLWALLCTTVLTIFVGLNVSVLGMIDFTGAPLGPVVEFFGLIVLLDAVFAVSYLVVRRGATP